MDFKAKIKIITDSLEQGNISSQVAADQIEALIKREVPLPEHVAQQIDFLQWMFRKVDRGDEPIESMRMINMHREAIESIKIPEYGEK